MLTLGLFLVFVVAACGAVYFCMMFASNRPMTAGARPDLERLIVAILLVTALSVALMMRPLAFGTDTLTYLTLYDQYCFSHVQGLELSYYVTFGLIDTMQAGACNSQFLTIIWAFAIVLSFSFLPDPWPTKLKIAGVALLSLVGIELATNALRQGISAAVMMLAVAWFARNRVVGLMLALFAVLLHVSSGLVVVAVALSMLRLRYFVAAFALLVALVLSYSTFHLQIGLLDRLVGEIDKYAQHDPDDLYIRILAAGQLALPPVIAVITRGWSTRASLEKRSDLSTALKISLTALPYLSLPYFGYRYIYGIYLIVLYLCREEILDDDRPGFEMLLIGNAVIALAWAFGSSAISQTPFAGAV